ncbi:MAG: PspC domain-containing protein [Pelolinea sp.]|nr:PspC domain-containing protein [Pelolinea sp.]
MAKRLYRSESNQVLGGVCAGLGDFLGIDPVFIRIFFVVWTILGEFSVPIYILLWVIVPRESSVDVNEKFEMNDLGARFRQMGSEIQKITRQPSSELIVFAGVGMIAWGVYYLVDEYINLNIWSYSQYIWPALLIIAGVLVIIRTTRKK